MNESKNRMRAHRPRGPNTFLRKSAQNPIALNPSCLAKRFHLFFFPIVCVFVYWHLHNRHYAIWKRDRNAVEWKTSIQTSPKRAPRIPQIMCTHTSPSLLPPPHFAILEIRWPYSLFTKEALNGWQQTLNCISSRSGHEIHRQVRPIVAKLGLTTPSPILKNEDIWCLYNTIYGSVIYIRVQANSETDESRLKWWHTFLAPQSMGSLQSPQTQTGKRAKTHSRHESSVRDIYAKAWQFNNTGDFPGPIFDYHQAGSVFGFSIQSHLRHFLMNIDEVCIYELVMRALREQSRLFSNLKTNNERLTFCCSISLACVVQARGHCLNRRLAI